MLDRNGPDASGRAALGRPLRRQTHQPILHHPGVQERPDQFEHPFVPHPLRQTPHQPVVVHSIEELLQVDIHDPAATLSDIPLRLGHRLVGRASGPKAIAVLGESPVPVLL